MTKPIGLCEYGLRDALPKNSKIDLPTIEELETQLPKKTESSNEEEI